MGRDLLLVGSIPLDTVEDVMRMFGAHLGDYLPAMPDGEVGERRSWVNRFCYQLFNGHADLETLRRPPSIDGVEQLLPSRREESWQFRVRPGVANVRFGLPGLRLGYARDATNSYFIFRTLREQGVLPADLRFQISIPMVNSVVRPLYFPDPADLDKVRPGFEEALAAELAVIVRRIPARDLAIQWDCAWELSAVYGASNVAGKEAELETHVAPIRRLSAMLPPDAALGFHFCFGTFGGWPAFAPSDLGRAVDLINAAVVAAGRRTDWIHIPTLNRTDSAFYAPLARLNTGGARVYLGMIHSMDTIAQRLSTVRAFVQDFGLAAYCGFGRMPPEQLPQVLEDHLKAVAIAGRSFMPSET
ncbi:MAG: hypothetical protein A3I01_15425 [Betaproteobacteria bacterium RIFCSPLOWO2_02_FULL_65_24]|nr:MAG: hypothetical protein A3I01_15425 [Betaproteobacteria bacterium RIFCSPLOWO2_02_FULL_65_24]